MDKKYLSKLTIGSNQYDLKDAEARQDIVDLKASVTGAMHWLGTATTAISDGLEMVDSEASDGQAIEVTIAGVKYRKAAPSGSDDWVQLKSGDVAAYKPSGATRELEFVYNDVTHKWQEYGAEGSLKALAFKDSATGSITCAGSNSDSAVSFSGTTTETVLKGIDDAAVAPSFTEGAFDAGSLPSFVEGTFSAGTLPSFTEGTFTQGTLPSFTEGAFSAGSLPSLGAATTGTFTTEGIVATVDESNELLTFSTASTSSAVTAQGTFDAGSLPSKAADTFSAGTLPTKAADTFSAGSLPSKDADTWSAGSLPSKEADTFSAGSAATFTTETVITGLGTATAAAQTFTGGTVSVTVS